MHNRSEHIRSEEIGPNTMQWLGSMRHYDEEASTTILAFIRQSRLGRIIEILIVIFNFQTREVLSPENRYYTWEEKGRSDPLSAEQHWAEHGGKTVFYQKMSHVLAVHISLTAWNSFQCMLMYSPTYIAMVTEQIGHAPTREELEFYYSDSQGHGFAEPLRQSFEPFHIT